MTIKKWGENTTDDYNSVTSDAWINGASGNEDKN
jgi:hypothetical protein